MALAKTFAGALALIALTACGSSNNQVERQVVSEVTGAANPYLWRASLDTLESLPVVDADPLGGLIIYDWHSFAQSPDERIKATVYILDTRLRADGVKVSVFRQERKDGEWVDAAVSPDTGIQLENRILERARALKVAEIS